jgi:hypothetical protein
MAMQDQMAAFKVRSQHIAMQAISALMESKTDRRKKWSKGGSGYDPKKSKEEEEDDEDEGGSPYMEAGHDPARPPSLKLAVQKTRRGSISTAGIEIDKKIVRKEEQERGRLRKSEAEEEEKYNGGLCLTIIPDPCACSYLFKKGVHDQEELTHREAATHQVRLFLLSLRTIPSSSSSSLCLPYSTNTPSSHPPGTPRVLRDGGAE